jgi:hypothetical protein
MCDMHRIHMLHNQTYTLYFFSIHSLSHTLSMLLNVRASTTIYNQVCELQGTLMIFYFSGHSGALSPP